jgi:hypothetical protein
MSRCARRHVEARLRACSLGLSVGEESVAGHCAWGVGSERRFQRVAYATYRVTDAHREKET